MAEAKDHIKISQHLKTFGISQSWIWKKGFVSKTQLSYYLKGNRTLKPEIIKRIKTELKIK
jgi:antitoxin component HigA of HigAB toxin-antitoxin module